MGRTIFASNLGKGGVVGITLGAGCVEGCFVWRIERSVLAESLRKIWIGEKGNAVADRIGPAFGNRLFARGPVKTSRRDHMSFKKLPQFFGAGTFLGPVPDILSGDAGDVGIKEAEFAELLPAVVLIDFSGAEPHIVSNAVWSGYTKPWKAAPFIREYLVRQVPELPPSLAACFDPQSPSFS